MSIFIVIAAVAAIAFCLLVVVAQDIFIFPGAYFRRSWRRTRPPQTLPDRVEAFNFPVSDGAKLEVWRLRPAAPTNARKLALICHGNADTLELFFEYQKWLAELGYDVFSYDYRGYGYSSGFPSEKNIKADSAALLAHVVTLGPSPQVTLLLGRSLGTGVASSLAAQVAADKLVLISPYCSIPSVTRDRFIFSLFARFCRTQFNTQEILAKVKFKQLVIIHGEVDKVVLPAHSRRILETLNPQTLVQSCFVPEADHDTVFSLGKTWLAEQIKN
jgi:alpha/beta superfamily hydrolase